MKRFIWVILVIGLTYYFQMENSGLEGQFQVKDFELGLSAIIVFALLGFPLSFSFMWVAIWLFRIISPDSGTISTEITIWLAGLSCLIGGYIQWFYLIPKLIKRKSKGSE